MRQNKYSIVKFYYRRIKRIYPALIIVFVFLIVVGCWRMLSLRLKMMTRSISIATVFGANLEFLTFKKDYFDPELSTNPVLHLWSLGVEEQFYIIWPLIIYIIVRFFEKRAIYILAGYTLLSFLLNVICVYENPKFAFYFPFSRFWEMAIGGIISYTNIRIPNRSVANTISVVGLIVITITLLAIN
jgi:peptidoglycan/LPS O-acetylase OafA/YrhL